MPQQEIMPSEDTNPFPVHLGDTIADDIWLLIHRASLRSAEKTSRSNRSDSTVGIALKIRARRI